MATVKKNLTCLLTVEEMKTLGVELAEDEAGGFFLRCHAFLPSRLRDAFSGNRPYHMPAF